MVGLVCSRAVGWGLWWALPSSGSMNGEKLTHDGKGAVMSENLFFMCDDMRNEKATFGKEPY